MPNIVTAPQFRIDNSWLLNEQFKVLVQKWWQDIKLTHDIGSSWHQKLKILRRKIRGWARNFLGEKNRIRREALTKIHSFS